MAKLYYYQRPDSKRWFEMNGAAYATVRAQMLQGKTNEANAVRIAEYDLEEKKVSVEPFPAMSSDDEPPKLLPVNIFVEVNGGVTIETPWGLFIISFEEEPFGGHWVKAKRWCKDNGYRWSKAKRR